MSATKYEVELTDSWHLTIRVIEKLKNFEDMVQERTFSLRRTQFAWSGERLNVQVFKRVDGEVVCTDTVYYEFESKKEARQIRLQVEALVREAADKNNLE
ncbi:MAG: hypothetical protein CMP20_04420 [Rickettsiales bacterium]|nr:hypothetical protein [Rickettsiales bacterium]